MALTVALTEEQQKIVTNLQKDEDNLPYYYNSDLRTDVQISREFEAFLILADPDLKTSANNWIKKASTIQTDDKDRDALSALALAQEQSNAQQKMNAIDAVLGDFNDFRTKFQANTTFVSVGEVQRFLFDLQKGIEPLALDRDRAQFDSVVSQVVQRVDDQKAVDSFEIQELQSWTGVLSAYLKG